METLKPVWERPVLIFPENATVCAERPKILEIGPGRGDFLWHLCTNYPAHQVIAIETKRRRFMKLSLNAAKRDITNLLLLCGDAREVVPKFIQPQRLDAIHIQFPDPWPKKRHAKHRLMQASSVALFYDVLKPKGELHFTTDVEWYAHDVADLFRAHGQWTSQFTPDPVQTTPLPQFNSYFATKWQKLGRTFYYQIWVKE